MSQTSISIRMDADLKKQFEEFCSSVGMNMSTAINIFAITTVREKRIPFEISAQKSMPNEPLVVWSDSLWKDEQ